jgi:hypothetical protein
MHRDGLLRLLLAVPLQGLAVTLAVTLASTSSCADPNALYYSGRSDFQGTLLFTYHEAEKEHKDLVIQNCTGGAVYESWFLISQMNDGKSRVRVEGKASSSCTMLVALDNLCYTPDAKFSFHSARYETDPPKRAEAANVYMEDKFPEKLRKAVTKLGLFNSLDNFRTLTGSQMGFLDNFPRFCQNKP